MEKEGGVEREGKRGGEKGGGRDGGGKEQVKRKGVCERVRWVVSVYTSVTKFVAWNASILQMEQRVVVENAFNAL